MTSVGTNFPSFIMDSRSFPSAFPFFTWIEPTVHQSGHAYMTPIILRRVESSRSQCLLEGACCFLT